MVASDIERRSYPKIPARNWFDLRRRIKQALPSAITVDYLQSVLGLEARSARNLLPPLRAIELIDENDRLTDLAHAWRSDPDYAEACADMLGRIYPTDLLAAFPGPDVDRSGVERWFMRNARVGEGAARQLAAFYLILAAPDLSEESEARAPKGRDATQQSRRAPRGERPETASGRGQAPPRDANPPGAANKNETPVRLSTPSIHVDVQVHIDPNASAEQIDKIFASMARHLYGRE